MSNHYYDINGAPVYTLTGANGKERKTNSRDARKLGLVPSFSTIVGVLDKPGVNIWKQQQLLEAVLEWPFNEELEVGEWRKQIFEVVNMAGAKIRERGTVVHDSLEDHFNGECIDPALEYILIKAITSIENKFGDVVWTTEKSFSYDGYGGKCDLHSKDGIGTVIDFKTKDVEDISKITTYKEQCMQLSAYRYGLGLPSANCYNLFINIRDGEFLWHRWKEEELQKSIKMFNCLKDYWYLLNNMEY